MLFSIRRRNHQTKGRVEMNPKLKEMFVGFVLVVIFIVFVGFCVVMLEGDNFRIPTSNTSTPTLYELAEQSATNARYTFWLLVVFFAAWLIRSYKTAK